MSERDLTDEEHADKIRRLISDLGHAIADAEKVGLVVKCIIRASDNQTLGADIVRKL